MATGIIKHLRDNNRKIAKSQSAIVNTAMAKSEQTVVPNQTSIMEKIQTSINMPGISGNLQKRKFTGGI